MDFEGVIGLEIHIELNTATKLFCNCPNNPGDPPNQNTCPICLWFPGAVPGLSRQAVDKAALLALALEGELQPRSSFDQKIYYYPDQPKGYQLTQSHQPLARGGSVEIIDEEGRVKKPRIHHIHMEEDMARLIHETEGRKTVSLVDFNRAGTPLVEIVTEPDFRSPFEVMEFLKVLRARVRYSGTSECSMEAGSMRVDANISIRPRGSEELNTKVEVKNMNSIRHLGDAVAYEISRQSAAVRKGEAIEAHTRLWDPDKKTTLPMRAKFEGPTIPDPGLPVIELDPQRIEELRSQLPEMPADRAQRFVEAYQVSTEEAAFLSSDPETAGYFEALVEGGVPPRTGFHWISTQLLPGLRERDLELPENPVSAQRLAELLAMLGREEINAGGARRVLAAMFDSDESPQVIVAREGLAQVSDLDQLGELVDQVLRDNPAAVEDLRSGKGKAMGFLMGQLMQASGGRANPKVLNKLVGEKLEKDKT